MDEEKNEGKAADMTLNISDTIHHNSCTQTRIIII